MPRMDGTSTAGEVRGVAGGTGRDSSGQEGSAASRSGNGSKTQRAAARKVSTSDLGIEGGTGRKTLTEVFALSNKAVREAVQLENEFGIRARYVTGDNLSILDRGGKEIDARAMVTGDGEIIVRADQPEFTPKQLLRHEIGHIQIRRGEISVEEVRDRIVKAFNEQYLNWAIEQYAAAYNLTGYSADAVFEEIICDALGGMNAFSENTKPLVEKFLQEVKQAAEESSETTRERGPPSETETSSEVKFSIERTTDNRQFVDVDVDILNGVPQNKWVSTVKQNLKQKFPNGITLGKNMVIINKQSREEMTYSKYMQNLMKTDVQVYEDKLRATNNADEILTATYDWVNEGLHHRRKDSITSFARGNILMQIGGRGYSAEVVVGTKKDGTMLLYDIIGMKSASFTQKVKSTKKETNTAIAVNPSPGVGRSTVPLSAQMITSGSQNVNPQSQENSTENSADEDSFSLERPVERVRDLVAVHNLSMQQLEQSLDLGGLPMPSIAIIKAEQGHSKYGDCSLVFGKNTVDPKANRNNEVYGGDAFTPTYPLVEYKASEAAKRRLSSKYYELSKKLGHDATRPLYSYANELEDTLNRAGSPEALMDEVRKDTALMQLYLDDSGKGHVEDITRTTRTELSTEKKAQNQQWIDALGESAIRGFKAPEGVKPMAYRRQYIAEHKSEILDAYEQQLRQQGLSDTEAAQKRDAVKNVEIMTWMRDALAYLNNGGVTERTEVDTAATDEAIRAKAADGYEAWVNELFSGVAEKSGIWNNQEPFTRSGNRRSWEALHWENNLENVVKAMRQQEATGNAFFGIGGIWGVAAKQYGTLNEVRADEGRLQSIPQEQYDAIKENYGQRFTEIAQSIVTRSSSGNPYIELDTACENIVDAIRKTKTKSGLLHYLQQYNPAATTATVDDIVQLVQDISNMPTGYFEAKPRRAVGFNEVATAIVPDSAPQSLRGKLDSAGVRTVYYTAGDEDARKSALNGLEGMKFSLAMPTQKPAPKPYSYNWFVQKPDMTVTLLDANVPTTRAAVIAQAKKNAAQVGRTDANGNVYVHVDDIDTDVLIGTGSLKHGLDRRFNDLAPVTLKAGEILKNAIRINEMTPTKQTASGSYILIGMAENTNGDRYVVRAVVNEIRNQLVSMDILYALHTKKDGAVPKAPGITANTAIRTPSTITIAQLLGSVNNNFPDILPADVLQHYGYAARPNGVLGQSVRFSRENPTTAALRKISDQTESKQFIRWFGDWENKPKSINPFLLNDDGTPKRFYHGTPNGTFSTFKAWQYFTDNKAYADLYQDQDASINGYKKTADNKHTYEVYLAPKKIFDTRKPKEQKIFQNEFYQQWGNGAPLSDKGLPDWTDGDDLIEFFDEKGYDYDAFLLDEGGTGGYGTEVKSRGISIVVRDSSAIKSATDNVGTFDRGNDDIRFSRENPTTAALQKQNEVLKEKLRLATESMKPGFKPQLSSTDVEKATRKLLRQYSSKAAFTDISSRMKQLGVKISEIGREQVRAADEQSTTLQQLRQDALAIAEDIVEQSSVMVNRGDIEYFANIRKFLYRTKISLQNTSDIADYDSFRKRNNRMGRFILSDEGTPIDVLWLQLQDEFGEGMFPDSIANPADQLMYLDKLYEDMQPLWENPMKAELDESAQSCANDILNTLLSDKIHLAPTTTADKLLEQRDQQWQKRLDQEYDRAQMQISSVIKEREQLRQYYTELRNRDRSDRSKREQKEKIRRVANRLSQVLNNESVNRQNVKEDMRGVTQRAVYLAELLFTDMRDDTLLKGNIAALTGKEAQLLDSFHAAAEERDRLQEEYLKLDLDGRRSEAGQELHTKLVDARVWAAKLREQLKDVAERERNRLKSIGAVKNAVDEMQKAYEGLKNSAQSAVAGAYDEMVDEKLKELSASLKETYIDQMSLDQLEDVYQAFTAMLTTIRNSNRLFNASIKESVAETAMTVETELGSGKRHKKLESGMSRYLSAASWNNEKPIYAFMRMGSDTMLKLYRNIRKGEDVWYTDISDAKTYLNQVRSDCHYSSWDMKQKQTFHSAANGEFQLDLEEMMSIYAYLRRGKQATDHLSKDGFVFDPNKNRFVKNRLGVETKKFSGDATAYGIDMGTIQQIANALTDDQKRYVEKMQDYLSDTMGEKGNEVFMQLYGFKRFRDKHYFPLRSAAAYKAKVSEQQAQAAKLKNRGFTKQTQPFARNPVVLMSFDDLWAEHVNEMSMYHAMTLPLEDFSRVYNFNTSADSMVGAESVQATILNALGQGADGYIKRLLTDINSGKTIDPTESVAKALTSKFKKTAVLASGSVFLRQFSAGCRAWAVIDPKYFRPTAQREVSQKWHRALWAEMKKYAPVCGIKEMGNFDTHMSRSAKDYLLAEEPQSLGDKAVALFKDGDYRDEVLGALPSWADEHTWIGIWEATKREITATHKELTPDSEEFLQATGERFTEIIELTQVYDSVFSRSANMRSGGALMGMATSFMAEPTTTANLAEYAVRQGMKGHKKQTLRIFGAIAANVIVDSLLGAIAYAARDDDDDKTLLEKYMENVVGGIMEGFNPLTYIPFVRDLWSIAQGYDVERTDMSMFSDLYTHVQKWCKLAMKDTSDMTVDELTELQKSKVSAAALILEDFTTLTGAPVRNIRREILAAANLFKSSNWAKSSPAAMGYAIQDGIISGLPMNDIWSTDSTYERLYYAIVNGDDDYRARLEASLGTEKKKDNAISRGLMENDDRIWEAAQKQYEGDATGRQEIAEQIEAEGHFTATQIRRAINSAVNKLDTGEDKDYEEKTYATYSADDYFQAAKNGDSDSATEIYDYLVGENQKDYYTYAEAQKSLASGFVTDTREAYKEGSVTEAEAIELMMTYGAKSNEEAQQQIARCDFELEYGISWSARERAYRSGAISKDVLIQAMMDIEGYTRAKAQEKIADWEEEWEEEGAE